MKFRSKPAECDAEQFTDMENPCRGVTVELGLVRNRAVVTTIQEQVVEVQVGEWIVQEPENPERFYPVKDSTFRNRWEPVP